MIGLGFNAILKLRLMTVKIGLNQDEEKETSGIKPVNPDLSLLDSYSQTVVKVAQRVSDAVVHIKVKKPDTNRRRNRRNRRPNGDYGSGSGFIISTDGFIVTNSHVVNGATAIEVDLQDGRQFKAKLIGDDPATDIAVVQINGEGLSTIEFCGF